MTEMTAAEKLQEPIRGLVEEAELIIDLAKSSEPIDLIGARVGQIILTTQKSARREGDERMRERCLEEIRDTYKGTSVSEILVRDALRGCIGRIRALTSGGEG